MAPTASTAQLEVLQRMRAHYEEKGIIKTTFVTNLSRTNLQGGFGSIQKATWLEDNSKVAVAVKFIKVEDLPSGGVLDGHLKRLRQEISAWQRLQHENVLKFRGVYWPSTELLPAMISDWEDEGNLAQYLADRTEWFSAGGGGPQAEQLKLVEGVLFGLAHLHFEGVIHADLKSENVLISPQHNALLGDFGISWANVKISVTFTKDRKSEQGTIIWMAPEILEETEAGALKYSVGSDIWAFGCLLSQILGNEPPWSNKTSIYTIIAAMIRGEFFPRPRPMQDKLYDSYWTLVYRCCMSSRSERPSATAVLSQLQLLRFLSLPGLPAWAESISSTFQAELETAMLNALRALPADTDVTKSEEYREGIAKGMARAMEGVRNALQSQCNWDRATYDQFKMRLSRQGSFSPCVLSPGWDYPSERDELEYASLQLNDTASMDCWRIVSTA